MSFLTISPAWSFQKKPRFKTTVQETAAIQGSVYIPQMVYPVWDFTFDVPLLQGRVDDPTSTVAQLLGLYLAAKGRAGNFLFNDTRDNTVTNWQFGTGDGTSQAFQLTRNIGGLAVDIVQNLNGTPIISINGTPTVLYAISNGLVTFNTPPAVSAALTWTGSFYFRLKFKTDTLADLKMFYEGKWDISMLEFESVIL